MKIVFFGTPEFVVPVLEKLQENFEVVGVVTAPNLSPIAKAVQGVASSSLSDEAQSLRVEDLVGITRRRLVLMTPEKLDQNFVQELKKLQPDLFIVASYGKIIPQLVLDIPKYGSLNIHPSLLPLYRGPSPIQTSILNGDKTSGVTILIVDSKMDHGSIVATKEISLLNKDTFDSLSKKMFLIGAELLVKIIPDFISGKIKPQEQNHENATFTKMFSKEDGYFDIDNPPSPEKLDRMIRAFYPWPTAWTKWNGKIVKFLPPYVIPAKAGIHGSRVKHGMTEMKGQNDKFLVQMEGKKPVKLEAFLNGYPAFPIKHLP